MSNFGFIKLHRKIKNWDWIDDAPTFNLFIHLLLNANYEDGKYRGQIIKRGQLKTGRIELAEISGLSERQVRTALKKLKTTNEITIESTNRFSIITLVNYNLYQDKEDSSDQLNDQPSDQQETSKRPTRDQQATTSKEEKERKKGRKEELNKKEKIQIPDFVDAKTWNDFLENRKILKAPNSNSAIKLVVEKLISFENSKLGNANQALKNSIENGWRGVFEPKEYKGQSPPKSSTEARREAFAKWAEGE